MVALAEPSMLQRVRRDDVARILARPLPWSQLSGCTVLVTGAGGFLGGYLLRTLLALHPRGLVERPLRVLAMVRDAARGAERLADCRGDAQLQLIEWDLGRIALPPHPELAACDYVLHAASQASPRYYGSDPVGTLLPNSVGTAVLFELLRRSGRARGLLFVSSSEVYGSVGQTEALREGDYGVVDPATVRACYAEGKRMGEATCLAYQHQHGVPTFIVRPFHTYGPGLQPGDGRVFADFAFNVARGESIVMTSDGSARRAFCYVSDAVAGFFTVLLTGQAGQPYNVANPAGELSVLELAELLVGLFPERGLKVERRLPQGSAYVPSPYSRLIPDVSRLAALGWSAEVAPAEGFRRMIEACA